MPGLTVNGLPKLAAAARLPPTDGHRDHVEAGGLMDDGPKLEESYRRAADDVSVTIFSRAQSPATCQSSSPRK